MSGIKRSEMLVIKLRKSPVEGKPIIVMSVSGGKDSLAMWIRLWESGVPNLVAVTFFGGWEWPCARAEIRRIEKLTGIKCRVLNEDGSFDQYLTKTGWPNWRVRWCAGKKRDSINKLLSAIRRGHPGFEIKSAIGIAADEVKRINREGAERKNIILPLVEMGLTERQCLKICGRVGCHWGGHYLRHDRLSCWCCPHQQIDDLRQLYNYDKDRWGLMLSMDKTAPEGRKFKWGGKSLPQIDKRFEDESKILHI